MVNPESAVDGMNLEQKAALTSGADFWNTKQVGDVPAIMVTDGPHGLRKQRGSADHLGINFSVPATCFPPAVALGATFDPELIERVGVALGEECATENVGVLLGPGINIKRSPLCGRNFEYFSEDPLVSGVSGSAWVKGVQSQGVGTSLKHFAANSQETDRLRSSSDIDPRPLREIYLRAFERVVKEAQPWTVMCSYNKINGVYASENFWLLTTVLRDEWDFEGLVVSDWGAVNDRVQALAAGLDLEMPSTKGRSDKKIVAAVQDGTLDESVLDVAAKRIAELVAKATETTKPAGPLSFEEHHALAREAATRSIILLKNDSDVLPLAREASIAVIGAFASEPRFQGAGSSLVNPTQVDDALTSIRELGAKVDFAPGFSIDPVDQAEEAKLVADAVAAASKADIAVLFLGLPARMESEGFDRSDIDLPADQLNLLEEVRKVNGKVVVVLSHGGVVALPFAEEVPAIVDASLLGQAGGSATADILFGVANPSAKLTETVPVRLEDNPSYGNFPGDQGHVRYGEGLLVGYRWYDYRDLPVTFPFGHGLSYTTFEYGGAEVSLTENGSVAVRVPVSNTGKRDGREVVQVYVSVADSKIERPVRELRAFRGIELAAGETRTVEMVIPREDLAYWDVDLDQWIVEGGEYTFEVAASSRDIRTSATLDISGDDIRKPLSPQSSMAEVWANPGAVRAITELVEARGGDASSNMLLARDTDMSVIVASLPVGRTGLLGINDEELEMILEASRTE